jgi:hypothetical protein
MRIILQKKGEAMRLRRQRWNPAAGLGALLVLFVLAGVVLSFAYLFWMEYIHNLAGRLAGPVLFGAGLGGAVFGIKRFFRITLDIPAFALVFVGGALVFFLLWGGFPLRGDIAIVVGDWILPERVIPVVGALEAAFIALPPLYAACRRAGVYLRRYDCWAGLRLMEYGFVPFSDAELDRLAMGEYKVILRKPIDLTGLERVHAVGLCYADKEITEYLAVFKASWDKQGNIEKGPLLLLTALTAEGIEDLQGGLYDIHRAAHP